LGKDFGTQVEGTGEGEGYAEALFDEQGEVSERREEGRGRRRGKAYGGTGGVDTVC
jgi:hypothetical protein